MALAASLPRPAPAPARERRPLRGLLVGALAGLIGAGTKALGEVIFPARLPAANPPPGILLNKLSFLLTRHPLDEPTRKVSVQIFHYAFGSAAGAVYGLLAEFFPLVTIGWGVGFGVALLLATHESLVPLLGGSVAPWKLPGQEQISELFTHGIFGATVETLRRWLGRR